MAMNGAEAWGGKRDWEDRWQKIACKFGCDLRSHGFKIKAHVGCNYIKNGAWGAYEVMPCEACDVKRVVVLLIHALNIDAEA